MLYIDACASWIRVIPRSTSMLILVLTQLWRYTTSLRNRTLRASCERCMRPRAIVSAIGSGTRCGVPTLRTKGWMSNRQEEGLRQVPVFRGRPRPRLWYNIRSISRRRSNQPRSSGWSYLYRTRPGRPFPRLPAARTAIPRWPPKRPKK